MLDISLADLQQMLAVATDCCILEHEIGLLKLFMCVGVWVGVCVGGGGARGSCTHDAVVVQVQYAHLATNLGVCIIQLLREIPGQSHVSTYKWRACVSSTYVLGRPMEPGSTRDELGLACTLERNREGNHNGARATELVDVLSPTHLLNAVQDG